MMEAVAKALSMPPFAFMLLRSLSNKSGMMGAGQKLGGSAAASAPAGEETPEQRRARMLAAAEARSKAQ